MRCDGWGRWVWVVVGLGVFLVWVDRCALGCMKFGSKCFPRYLLFGCVDVGVFVGGLGGV